MGSKTAVIYARFSCSKQREASIEDQLRVCREWCSREGYEVVKEYSDYALSGRSDDRPQFQTMIANAGESDIVLVYMMDRFSRDEYDAPVYKRELRKHGVELYSAMEAMPDGPERILIEKIYEGLAAVESAKTAIRVKRGMTGNALKCKTNGVRLFGYDEGEDGCYVINEDEAVLVREAFKRKIEGEPVNHIASDFAKRGVKTYVGRPCGYNMIYHMLKSEKYMGVYSWGDVRVEGGMPAIVDKGTFMRAQEIKTKKRRKDENWCDYALAGRVICASCGRNFYGMSGHSRSGKRYDYYTCGSCKEVKAVRKDWLEGEITSRIREMLKDRDTATRIADMFADAQDDKTTREARKSAQNAKQSAETGLANILAAIEQGIIAPGTQERIAQLEIQRDKAERDLASLKDRTIDPEDFVDFLMFGATLDDKQLLDAFVYQVMISNEDVIVVLNYNTKENEPARFTFERVRTNLRWCPVRKLVRTQVAVLGTTIYVKMGRAA